jgi:hypothetical protein
VHRCSVVCLVLGVRLAGWLSRWHRREIMAQGLAAVMVVYWSPSNSPITSLSAIARAHSEATSSSPLSSRGLSVFAKRSIAYGPEFAGSEAGPPMRNTIVKITGIQRGRAPAPIKDSGGWRHSQAACDLHEFIGRSVSEFGVWAHVDRLRSAPLHCSLTLGTKRRIRSIRYAGRPVSGW